MVIIITIRGGSKITRAEQSSGSFLGNIELLINRVGEKTNKEITSTIRRFNEEFLLDETRGGMSLNQRKEEV